MRFSRNNDADGNVKVSPGPGGSHIIVPVERLDDVKALLEKNDFTYVISSNGIFLDGRSVAKVIDIYPDDVKAIQELLDQIE